LVRVAPGGNRSPCDAVTLTIPRPFSDLTFQPANASDAVNPAPFQVAVTFALSCSSASPALKIDKSIGFSPSCKTFSLCLGRRPDITADNVGQLQLRVSVAIGAIYQINSCKFSG